MTQLSDHQAAGLRLAPAWGAIAQSQPWWLVLLAASVASAVVFPHAPLAAFAAIAGVSLPRQRAIALIGIQWLLNQSLGFGWRGYPLEAIPLAWGLLMGAGALVAVVVAGIRPAFSLRSWGGAALWGAIALLASFGLYQGLIVAAAPLLAAEHGLDTALLWRLFEIHVRWIGAIAPAYALLWYTTHRHLHPHTPTP